MSITRCMSLVGTFALPLLFPHKTSLQLVYMGRPAQIRVSRIREGRRERAVIVGPTRELPLSKLGYLSFILLSEKSFLDCSKRTAMADSVYF